MGAKEPSNDLFAKAKEAFQAGHYPQALNLLTSLNLEQFDSEAKVEALTLTGISNFEIGNRETALEKIKEALAINPHYAPALDGFGDILQEEGKLYAAIAKYRDATKADPTFWEPYFHWGFLLKRMGSPKAALRKLQSALEINPDHVESYIHAGDCAFELELFNEALTLYGIAQEKGGETSEILTRIGNAYLNMGNRDKAVESYQHAIKLDPMDGTGYENWGLVMHQEGKLDEAARKFEEGLIHAPQSPTLLLRHGEVLIAMGKFKESLNPLLKAHEILIEKMEGVWALHWAGILADCCYMLGFANRKLEQERSAREYFLEALRYAPNHIDALGELSVLRGVYREHHVKWDFVLEGTVETEKGKKTGLRAYRVAALTIEEAMRYVKECEDEISGDFKAREVTHSDQVASYAGVLARGPIFLIGRASKE